MSIRPLEDTMSQTRLGLIQQRDVVLGEYAKAMERLHYAQIEADRLFRELDATTQALVRHTVQQQQQQQQDERPVRSPFDDDDDTGNGTHAR